MATSKTTIKIMPCRKRESFAPANLAKFIPKKLVTNMRGKKIVEMIVSFRTISESLLF